MAPRVALLVDREMTSKKEMFPKTVANVEGNKSSPCHLNTAAAQFEWSGLYGYSMFITAIYMGL